MPLLPARSSSSLVITTTVFGVRSRRRPPRKSSTLVITTRRASAESRRKKKRGNMSLPLAQVGVRYTVAWGSSRTYCRITSKTCFAPHCWP